MDKNKMDKKKSLSSTPPTNTPNLPTNTPNSPTDNPNPPTNNPLISPFNSAFSKKEHFKVLDSTASDYGKMPFMFHETPSSNPPITFGDTPSSNPTIINPPKKDQPSTPSKKEKKN